MDVESFEFESEEGLRGSISSLLVGIVGSFVAIVKIVAPTFRLVIDYL